MKKRNSHTNRNWIVATIIIISIMVKPVSEVIKISNFIIADYIVDIEKTNQNDILEIDESQFDKEFLNKSKKSLGQFEFRKTKLVRFLNSISYTKVDIDVIIPPPDYTS